MFALEIMRDKNRFKKEYKFANFDVVDKIVVKAQVTCFLNWASSVCVCARENAVRAFFFILSAQIYFFVMIFCISLDLCVLYEFSTFLCEVTAG